jgi:glycosyltransferase involved in cell wall biosynthesis
MPVESFAEIVRFHLEELGRHARGRMLEWNRSDPGFLRRVAQAGGAMQGKRDLTELLLGARLEDRAADAGADRVDCLFVRRPGDWPDPAELLRRAADRIAPGGVLLISLDGEPEPNARIAEVDAVLAGLNGVSLRAVRRAGDAALVVARRDCERLRVALLPDAPGACLQIRTLGPLEELESRGLIELCLLSRDADPSTLADKDLLILQRFGGLAAAEAMLTARRMGVPVAVELDDDFFNLPWYNPGSESYGRREVRVSLTALLRGADAVVTSTPYLLRRMQQFNEHVHCMHNIVDTEMFARRESPFVEPGVTTFGYIGTKTHEEDFRPVLEPLKELILGGEGRVRAVFIGHVPDELRRLPWVRYLGWFATYQNAAGALARSGANIALAPLMDVEFNRSKSAMKYLEYGACGIPGIFSDVEAYRSFVRHRQNGLLVPRHAPEAWAAAMRFIVDNPAERERLADAAHRDIVDGHSIHRRAGDFLELYRGIVDRVRERRAGDLATIPVEPTPGGADALTLVLNMYREPAESLPVMALLADGIEKEARVTVISGDRELSELLAASGDPRVIPLHDHTDDARLNGMAEALHAARSEWVLYVDGRCKVPNDLLLTLVAQVAPGVAAIGPRTTDAGTEQSVQSVIGASTGAGLHESLTAYAADHPSTPATWLDPHCVLLNRAAAEAVGGIDTGLIWEDALVDLCLRLNGAGHGVLVANGTHIETRADEVPRAPPGRWAPPRTRLSPEPSASRWSACSTRRDRGTRWCCMTASCSYPVP